MIVVLWLSKSERQLCHTKIWLSFKATVLVVLMWIADAATLVGMKLDEYADFEVPLVVDSVFSAKRKHSAVKKRKRA